MKISVIVPVYNTEKYVSRCIDSILAQTYSNWELFLIDDGSFDGSPQILDTYGSKDQRITVIHQKNAGPGTARNKGIEKASGDYIVFIDSDDVIKPYYFEKLSKETADVVFIDIDQVDENFNIVRKEYLSVYHALSKNDFIREQITGKILWGGVRKAVKLDIVLKNQIGFSDHHVGEEAIYSFLIMHFARTFSFVNDVVYEYVNRTGSQSSNTDVDPLGDVVISLRDKMMQMGIYEQYADTINAFNATSTIISLDRLAMEYSGLKYRRIANERIKRYQNEIDKDYPVDLRHMPTKAKLLYPFLKIGWSAPIHVASCMRRMLK